VWQQLFVFIVQLQIILSVIVLFSRTLSKRVSIYAIPMVPLYLLLPHPLLLLLLPSETPCLKILTKGSLREIILTILLISLHELNICFFLVCFIFLYLYLSPYLHVYFYTAPLVIQIQLLISLINSLFHC